MRVLARKIWFQMAICYTMSFAEKLKLTIRAIALKYNKNYEVLFYFKSI